MTMNADLNRESDTRAKVRRQSLPFTTRRTPKFSRTYGRFVGIMRVLLPTVATALIILVALWPQLTDQQRRYSTPPSDRTTISSSTSPVTFRRRASSV